MSLTGEPQRLAVLIDADNAQAALMAPLLAEVATLGAASIRRAYGDWTTTRLQSWKAILHEHAVQPVQQFSYTAGKNATDSALIIDAMDLLYTHSLQGFCLVSSDSDFTRLATRLRESGLAVYGFGSRKTPRAFVTACDRFTFTELLLEAVKPVTEDLPARPPRQSAAQLQDDAALVTQLLAAVDTSADKEGWSSLSQIAAFIEKHLPTFQPRNYGYSRFGQLVLATELFEVEMRIGKSAQKQAYLRRARPPEPAVIEVTVQRLESPSDNGDSHSDQSS